MAPQDKALLEATSRPTWFGAFAVAAALVGLAGGFAAYDALHPYKPNMTVGGAGLAALALALGSLLGVATFARRQLRIDSGGIQARAGLGDLVRIGWSEPHDLFYEAIGTEGALVVLELSIRASNGRRIDVGTIRAQGKPNTNVPKLVEQQSVAASWPRMQARLEAGDDVQLGAVRVSRQRLRIGALEVPMDRPISLQVEQGKLKVGAEGTWTASEVAIREVANYACLLRAIGQTTQARPPS
jgi:hypothetical protein